MTLFEALGLCPLHLWLEYHEKGRCLECPMEAGVDVGVGWIQHCGHECTGGIENHGAHEEDEDWMF
jgi:hypothetical protein